MYLQRFLLSESALHFDDIDIVFGDYVEDGNILSGDEYFGADIKTFDDLRRPYVVQYQKTFVVLT